MDIRENIEQLTRRINELALEQSDINRRLLMLMKELDKLKEQAASAEPVAKVEQPVETIEFSEPIVAPQQTHKQAPPPPPPAPAPSAKKETSLEELVGKNIASKVGILVTVIGIFIGARYAIEHNLVSPLVRIIAGYVSGAALVVLAIFLKKKYTAYSSVLMGGGIAVLYFITYIAYGYYLLLPQAATFVLMLVFTVAAVYASLVYDKVFIAHLGLVGAYAIPFLLSDNSGRYIILFSYIAIINAGILVLSFRKYWKSLFYVAFAATWLIYLVWRAWIYKEAHFTLALLFSALYFLMFYATFLSYKLVRKERFNTGTAAILLSNAFLFFGMGYEQFDNSAETAQYLGLFTVVNAALHFLVSVLIRPRVVDRALYFVVFGLSLLYLTLAVPIQFDGNWVTLIWVGEAALLFIVGRTRRATGYEALSAGLIILGAISLMHDWGNHPLSMMNFSTGTQPFANITFFTGLFVIGAYGAVTYFHHHKKYPSPYTEGSLLRVFFDYPLPVLLLLVTYIVFFIEIRGLFSFATLHEHGAGGSFGNWTDEVESFRHLILYLYSLLFVAGIYSVNRKWFRIAIVNGGVFCGIVVLTGFLFLNGFPALNDLAAGYLKKDGAGFYFGAWNVILRYVIFAALLLLLLTSRAVIKLFGEEKLLQRFRFVLIHSSILGMLSAEYLLWTGISGDGDQYKLGLSILWGLYALFLIVYGIRKRQIVFRVGGIVLFVATLVKLFVYDLEGAGTVTKTISFISLGVLLLVVSHLYNRYKDVLFGKDEKESRS